MAAAYGRLTGKPGVVLVTSGPGVSNLCTGLLTATTEGDPIIALGGSVPLSMKYKQSHQSADNVSLMQAATKLSLEVVSAEAVPEIIANAFRVALLPNNGAVFISLPQDVMLKATTVTAPDVVPAIKENGAPEHLINKAAEVINQASCPILFLGQEASRPNNTKAIRAFLHQSPMACVSTYQAAGVISRDLFEYFAGRVGLFQNQPGDKLLEKADVIITVGFNPTEYDPEVWNKKNNKKIIHLDYLPANLRLTYMPAIELIGDIEKSIETLSTRTTPKTSNSYLNLIQEAHNTLNETVLSGAKREGERIHPLRFIHDLREIIDDDCIILGDVGSNYIWLSRYFFTYEPHHLLFSNWQQTLGVAMPWAMAAKLIYPNKKIISISGDGGFLFSAMELETAVREKLPFIHIVWRDGCYNMVAEQQMMKYHRDSAVYFNDIHLVKFAESFGAVGYRVQQAEEIKPILQEAFQSTFPVIIDVPIDYSDNASLFEILQDKTGN